VLAAGVATAAVLVTGAVGRPTPLTPPGREALQDVTALPARDVPAARPGSAPGAPAAPAGSRSVPGTPCTSTAKACVDVDSHLAWLVREGTVVRGPVAMMPGDPEDPTPTGTFHVQWKAVQHTSREYLVEMPYSVFFADGGIAFHEGGQDTFSAGCVKLDHDDAVAFFQYLQVGDEVQVP